MPRPDPNPQPADPCGGPKLPKVRKRGIAFSYQANDEATVSDQGVAYAMNRGTAKAGSQGVCLSVGGYACTGDSGAAIVQNATGARHNGGACCGEHGVAMAVSKNHIPGKVRGEAHATFVLIWKVNHVGFSVTARVGDEVNDCKDKLILERNTWYTLDPNDNYKWIEA